MTRPIKNMSASVRDRLMNKSKERGKTFDEIMTLYMMERFLYRLSYSKYCEQFILKGGFLLCVLFDDDSRTTRDLDFAARQILNQQDTIKDIFQQICSIKYDDGLVFDLENINTVRIKEDVDYEGIRISIICNLGQAKKQIQIDIGFGDAIASRIKSMKYPTILDMDNPEIFAYPLESVVAEKFEAMVSLAELNSRMKDFYDIYTISLQFDFDGTVLHKAIFETFLRRNTVFDEDLAVFTDEFKRLSDKKQQWNAYMKRSIKRDLKFEEVLNVIKIFLQPIFAAIVDKKDFSGKWSAHRCIWENAK